MNISKILSLTLYYVNVNIIQTIIFRQSLFWGSYQSMFQNTRSRIVRILKTDRGKFEKNTSVQSIPILDKNKYLAWSQFFFGLKCFIGSTYYRKTKPTKFHCRVLIFA